MEEKVRDDRELKGCSRSLLPDNLDARRERFLVLHPNALHLGSTRTNWVSKSKVRNFSP